jgi:hypothetical protein
MVAPINGYDTMAVNMMIPIWPWHLDFAVSAQKGILRQLTEVRSIRLNKPVTYSKREEPGIDYYGRFKVGGMATSGMYAVCVGLHLGYKKIIVAGIPFDTSGHFYDPPTLKSNFDFNSKQKLWEEVKGMSGDKVRFISGNLVHIFGGVAKE